MKVLFLIFFCFALCGCASLKDFSEGMLMAATQPRYQMQTQAAAPQQPVTVITQPYVIEQPNYPAPDRYLYKK